MNQLQIAGCRMTSNGEVEPFVSDEESDMWSVYLGEPGDYTCLADFYTKDEAEMYLSIKARNTGLTIHDRTFTMEKLK